MAAAGVRGRLARLAAPTLFGIAVVLSAAARADEAFDYVMHCRGCHGPEGQGAPGGAPDLRQSVGRFLLVPGGREYLIRVPGTAQSELDDGRTAALLNWMVRRFGPAAVAADFAPFTAAEVAAHRGRPLVEVRAVRTALLAALGGGLEPARPPR